MFNGIKNPTYIRAYRFPVKIWRNNFQIKFFSSFLFLIEKRNFILSFPLMKLLDSSTLVSVFRFLSTFSSTNHLFTRQNGCFQKRKVLIPKANKITQQKIIISNIHHIKFTVYRPFADFFYYYLSEASLFVNSLSLFSISSHDKTKEMHPRYYLKNINQIAVCAYEVCLYPFIVRCLFILLNKKADYIFVLFILKILLLYNKTLLTFMIYFIFLIIHRILFLLIQRDFLFSLEKSANAKQNINKNK